MTDEDEEKVKVEYTPAELVAALQLFDYMEIEFFDKGLPMGIISVHREKILESLLKEGIYSEMTREREENMEKFHDMMNPPEKEDKGSGFH